MRPMTREKQPPEAPISILPGMDPEGSGFVESTPGIASKPPKTMTKNGGNGKRRPPVFTDENRALSKVRRKEIQAARKQAGAHFRQDFHSASLWERLAHDRGYRLPAWHAAPTPNAIKRELKRLGIPLAHYYIWEGAEGPDGLTSFARLNPNWPLRALCGLLLEELAACGTLVDEEHKQ